LPINIEILNEKADWQCPWCGFNVIYFREGNCAENQKLLVEHIISDENHIKKWKELRKYMSKYEIAIDVYAVGEQILREIDVDVI